MYNSLGYGYSSSDIWMLAVLAMFVVSLIAQGKVQRTFSKYSQLRAACGLSAYQVASNLLMQNGSNVVVTEVGGRLTDHYNPKTGEVGLSNAVYGESSVAALAVAAHEIGHVQQHEEGYGPIKLRNAVLPVAQIGSTIAPYIIILGLFIGSWDIGMVGICLYAAVLLFQLVTLPVEFNASSRGIAMLTANGYLSSYDEEEAARKVLKAAAMTYVVAALATFASLMRFIALFNRRRD